MPRTRLALPLAGVAALALVLVVLLAPHHTDLPIAWLSASHLLGDAVDGGTPLWWLLEDLGNIALFVPLGLVLALRLRPVTAWALATAGSACCEIAQLWIPTRHASVLDVAMNSVGALLGTALVVLRRRAARRRDRQAISTIPHAAQAQ